VIVQRHVEVLRQRLTVEHDGGQTLDPVVHLHGGFGHQVGALALGVEPRVLEPTAPRVVDDLRDTLAVDPQVEGVGQRLEPQVAAPHSPANSAGVTDYEPTRIDVAYIGACTGAKYVDLKAAADIIRGRTLAKGVELLVAPSSKRDQERAERDGIMKIFEDAGAKVLPNACGICAGYGSARLGEDVTCISTTARNFKGRMGAKSSMVYLGSPYTVAASAIAGRIADPREIGANR